MENAPYPSCQWKFRNWLPFVLIHDELSFFTSFISELSETFLDCETPNTETVVREAADQTPVMWHTSASIVSFETGKTYKFKCPSSSKESVVWGTGIYTLDSSICNAAIHAGKLASESGGLVTIELRPGESAYKGTTRNGIKTNDYGAYGQSFVVK